MSSDYEFALVMACLAYTHSLSAGGDDYLALPTFQLMLGPGNQSVEGNVSIVNNTAVEKYQEIFTLHLQTDQRNVIVMDGFGNTTVTILDDDSKWFQHITHIYRVLIERLFK